MKRNVFYLLGVILLGSLSPSLFAQDYNDDADDTHDISIVIPEVTLLDIETEGSTVTLTLGYSTTPGGEAGLAPDATTQNKDLWLNYTSLSSLDTRKVTVALTAGTVPAGMKLYVTPGSITTGAGERGTPVSNVEITGTAADVITGIGSCYTDDGVNNGSKLTYSLGIDDWTTLTPGTTTGLTVTYTLTD